MSKIDLEKINEIQDSLRLTTFKMYLCVEYLSSFIPFVNWRIIGLNLEDSFSLKAELQTELASKKYQYQSIAKIKMQKQKEKISFDKFLMCDAMNEKSIFLIKLRVHNYLYKEIDILKCQ